MSPELEHQLVADFPQIFRDYGGDPSKTCMAFGIECGDGWEPLIRRLCESIMATNPPQDFCASQIKEKFGGLRFYSDCAPMEIWDLIEESERQSYKTCEMCGSTENVTSEGHWITTLCEKCRQ